MRMLPGKEATAKEAGPRSWAEQYMSNPSTWEERQVDGESKGILATSRLQGRCEPHETALKTSGERLGMQLRGKGTFLAI